MKYQVNEKSSKRWSSGFHTITSHSDCKDILIAPPSWDENGNIIYGGSDQMLTYFDINKKLFILLSHLITMLLRSYKLKKHIKFM